MTAMFPAKEQNGMKEEGLSWPSSRWIWTGWLVSSSRPSTDTSERTVILLYLFCVTEVGEINMIRRGRGLQRSQLINLLVSEIQGGGEHAQETSWQVLYELVPVTDWCCPQTGQSGQDCPQRGRLKQILEKCYPVGIGLVRTTEWTFRIVWKEENLKAYKVLFLVANSNSSNSSSWSVTGWLVGWSFPRCVTTKDGNTLLS